MNTMLGSKLFVVPAASIHCKLFFIYPFHFRYLFSTQPHSQTLFSQFASTKLNLSEADISRILKSRPRLQNLRTIHNAENIIHSFKKHGWTEVQIGKLLRKNPSFLWHSLENNILPTMEFLKNVFRSQDVLVKALFRAPRLLNCSLEKTLKPSLAFWEGWGFSGTELVSFLRVNAFVLSRTSLTLAQVDLINKICADKECKVYKYIVSVVARSRMETLEARMENLKLCGLSAEETRQVFGSYPVVLTLSKENVSEKMNFLVNNIELPANYVVKHPSLLQISLEKTLKPRFLVWQKIKSINASELPLLTVLTMAETRFVNRIIKEHPESKVLWTIYENAISNASNRTKSSTKQNFG